MNWPPSSRKISFLSADILKKISQISWQFFLIIQSKVLSEFNDVLSSARGHSTRRVNHTFIILIQQKNMHNKMWDVKINVLHVSYPGSSGLKS